VIAFPTSPPPHPDAALFALKQQLNTADTVDEVAAIFLEIAATRLP
jgi:hypothetical protein